MDALVLDGYPLYRRLGLLLLHPKHLGLVHLVVERDPQLPPLLLPRPVPRPLVVIRRAALVLVVVLVRDGVVGVRVVGGGRVPGGLRRGVVHGSCGDGWVGEDRPVE